MLWPRHKKKLKNSGETYQKLSHKYHKQHLRDLTRKVELSDLLSAWFFAHCIRIAKTQLQSCLVWCTSGLVAGLAFLLPAFLPFSGFQPAARAKLSNTTFYTMLLKAFKATISFENALQKWGLLEISQFLLFFRPILTVSLFCLYLFWLQFCCVFWIRFTFIPFWRVFNSIMIEF